MTKAVRYTSLPNRIIPRPQTLLINFDYTVNGTGELGGVTTNKFVNTPMFPSNIYLSSLAPSGSADFQSEDNWFVMSTWQRDGGNSNKYVVLNGVVGGKSFTNFELPLISQTGRNHATATVVEGFLYVRSGDSIYVYDPNEMSYPQRYTYAGVLQPGDFKMVYNERSMSLIMSCYNYSAICSIPLFDGSLGVAVVEKEQ